MTSEIYIVSFSSEIFQRPRRCLTRTAMCIALLATSHPQYALIVLNNRDEIIGRPTSRPAWYELNGQDVLSARDLQRVERGSWLGITRKGKLAILTNVREVGVSQEPSERSRGALTLAWLGSADEVDAQSFAHTLAGTRSLERVGGFSMIVGQVGRRAEGLHVVSKDRTTVKAMPLASADGGRVFGLSNAPFDGARDWPKVSLGREQLQAVIDEALCGHMDQRDLVERLFGILDTDTLPRRNSREMLLTERVDELQETIFVPLLATTVSEGDGAPYGTQRQTVILVDVEGHVTYVERALNEATVKVEFDLE